MKKDEIKISKKIKLGYYSHFCLIDYTTVHSISFSFVSEAFDLFEFSLILLLPLDELKALLILSFLSPKILGVFTALNILISLLLIVISAYEF